MLMELTDIKKEYLEGKNLINVLKGVSFTVGKGEFISVMGPSGSGKTTLMNILGCLDRPTSGSYKLDGIEINTLSKGNLAEIRGKMIGFVFQNFNLLPRLNALENVEVPMIYNGTPASVRHKEAFMALETVGLADRTRHLPAELSGGQKQRVAIARALVNKPKIILADEPTGNLDSKAGAEIIDLFYQLNSAGTTIILVTHDITIARLTQRIIHVKDGEIVTDKKVGVG